MQVSKQMTQSFMSSAVRRTKMSGISMNKKLEQQNATKVIAVECIPQVV